jgi:hypothetical protein
MTLTTVEKFDRLSAICPGGLQVQVNQHRMTRKDSKTHDHQSVKEYLWEQKKDTNSPHRDLLTSKELYDHIVKTNQLVEVYLYTDTKLDIIHLVHYDFALAINEAWGIMKLLGKVTE